MRLIDADKLNLLLGISDRDIYAKYMLDKMQTIDAVPVVRCRECKFWHEIEGWCDEHSHFTDSEGEFCHPWESSEWRMFAGNDFCSYGERKEGADNG